MPASSGANRPDSELAPAETEALPQTFRIGSTSTSSKRRAEIAEKKLEIARMELELLEELDESHERSHATSDSAA